jgi:hypothetical protein
MAKIVFSFILPNNEKRYFMYWDPILWIPETIPMDLLTFIRYNGRYDDSIFDKYNLFWLKSAYQQLLEDGCTLEGFAFDGLHSNYKNFIYETASITDTYQENSASLRLMHSLDLLFQSELEFESFYVILSQLLDDKNNNLPKDGDYYDATSEFWGMFNSEEMKCIANEILLCHNLNICDDLDFWHWVSQGYFQNNRSAILEIFYTWAKKGLIAAEQIPHLLRDERYVAGRYDWRCFVFYEDYTIFKRNALVDKNDKAISPTCFNAGSIFSEQLEAVCLNGKWGYVDNSFNPVIDFIYGEADFFTDGYARVFILNPEFKVPKGLWYETESWLASGSIETNISKAEFELLYPNFPKTHKLPVTVNDTNEDALNKHYFARGIPLNSGSYFGHYAVINTQGKIVFDNPYKLNFELNPKGVLKFDHLCKTFHINSLQSVEINAEINNLTEDFYFHILSGSDNTITLFKKYPNDSFLWRLMLEQTEFDKDLILYLIENKYDLSFLLTLPEKVLNNIQLAEYLLEKLPAGNIQFIQYFREKVLNCWKVAELAIKKDPGAVDFFSKEIFDEFFENSLTRNPKIISKLQNDELPEEIVISLLSEKKVFYTDLPDFIKNNYCLILEYFRSGLISYAELPAVYRYSHEFMDVAFLKDNFYYHEFPEIYKIEYEKRANVARPVEQQRMYNDDEFT